MTETTTDRFGVCLAETLRWEGGWSNHPQDPGGATMRGVIQRVYDAYRERKGLPRQTVRNIADDELRDIYRTGYWEMVGGRGLAPGLDLAMFDFGVNSGPTRAVSKLQTILGVKVDGHMGPVTLEATKWWDTSELVSALCKSRRKFVRQIRTYPTFGKGWERRINGIEAASLAVAGRAIAAPSPRPSPDADKQSAERAQATQEPKSTSSTAVGTAVAVGSGAVTTVANQTIQAPPEALQESVKNVGLWQQLGQKAAEFGHFVINNPVEIGLIVVVVAAIWFAPRLLPVIWSRAP